MKRNQSVRGSMRRENTFFDRLFLNVQSFSRYARLMLECIVRRNFGEQYYSFASCVTVLLFLVLFPIVWEKLVTLYYVKLLGQHFYYVQRPGFLTLYATWYLFTVFFLFCALRRRQEVNRPVAEFDKSTYSLHMGDIDPRFFKIRFGGKIPTSRKVEIVYEPAFFLIIGLVLKLAGQPLGSLLIVASILYSLSYMAAYKEGDKYTLKLLDGAHRNKMNREIIGNLSDRQPGQYNIKKPRHNQFGGTAGQAPQQADEETMVE